MYLKDVTFKFDFNFFKGTMHTMSPCAKSYASNFAVRLFIIFVESDKLLPLVTKSYNLKLVLCYVHTQYWFIPELGGFVMLE